MRGPPARSTIAVMVTSQTRISRMAYIPINRGKVSDSAGT